MAEVITNIQRSILQAAAARSDRILVVSDKLKGGAVKQIAAKFLGAGWVKELKASKEASVWRRDTAAGKAFSLKLTSAGLRAVKALAGAPSPKVIAVSALATTEAKVAVAPIELASKTGGDELTPWLEATGDLRAPRPGSKLDQVQQMLRADGGATINEIMEATSWLPHSTRAVLTGPAQAGLQADTLPKRAKRRVRLSDWRTQHRTERVKRSGAKSCRR